MNIVAMDPFRMEIWNKETIGIGVKADVTQSLAD